MTTRTGPAGAAGRPGLVAAGLVNVQLAQHREKLKQDQEPALILRPQMAGKHAQDPDPNPARPRATPSSAPQVIAQ